MEKVKIFELVNYKIEKANSTFSEVQSHIENKYLSTAMNRIYYSAFYLVSALALLDNFSTSKHKQLIGFFNREYVKTKLIDERIAHFLDDAYDNRIISDYHDFSYLTKSDIEKYYDRLKVFMDKVKILIDEKLRRA